MSEASAAFVLCLMLCILAMEAAKRRTYPIRAFGKDQWGTASDARKAGLFGGSGVVFGRMGRKLLTYDGPEHQLHAGASRSGKGVGIVIPTLLSWKQSAFVYDVKNELGSLTSAWRSRFGHVLFFNPTRADSACFNPLWEVRKGPNEVRDVQNIVEILANPDGSKQSPEIWDSTAGQFLVGLILHILYTAKDEDKHLGTVRDKLLDFESTCDEMLSTYHRQNEAGEWEQHPEVARVADSLNKKHERFQTSVLGTAESFFTLLADEVVRNNISRSDFSLGDLMCAERPVTLYYQHPPSDADRLRPLTRLFLNQLTRSLTEEIETDTKGRRKRFRLLLLLDEFPSLGRLPFFETQMGQMAGYGLKAMLMVQSFNHIVKAYGAANVIIDNCHLLTSYASADTTTQQRISTMTGSGIEYRASYSSSDKVGGTERISRSETVRPLLDAGAVRTLADDEQLVFITGCKPLRVKKLRYFKHRRLRKLTGAAELARIDTPGKPTFDWKGVRAASFDDAIKTVTEEVDGPGMVSDINKAWESPGGPVTTTEEPSLSSDTPHDINDESFDALFSNSSVSQASVEDAGFDQLFSVPDATQAPVDDSDFEQLFSTQNSSQRLSKPT